MTPSHRLKLYRADKHLIEMQALVAPLAGRREYPVVETMQPKRKGPVWEYRLDLSAVEPPEDFPIILGDYLFDIRSALDHLVVALAPKKHRRRVSFPICVADPLAQDEATGDYVQPEEARKWRAIAECLPNRCVAALKALQPYEAALRTGKPARQHPLAILSALQNADKHRELIGILTGLEKAEAWFDGEPEGAVPVLKHNAIVVRAPAQMDVKIEGIAMIGVRRGNEAFGLGVFTDRLLSFIADELLPRLEPLL